MSQILHESFGGTRTFTMHSGKAGDAITIWSGGGILNSLMVINWVLSGGGINLFDVAPVNVVSGLAGFAGPSGFNLVGSVPGHFQAGSYNSGSFNPPSSYDWQRPWQVGTPFFSGLAFSAASGVTSFTATYTPGKPQD